MADASDSKSDGGDLVWVQVPSPASKTKRGSSAELLLQEDGSVKMIRRAETPADYFATFDCFDYKFEK